MGARNIKRNQSVQSPPFIRRKAFDGGIQMCVCAHCDISYRNRRPVEPRGSIKGNEISVRPVSPAPDGNPRNESSLYSLAGVEPHARIASLSAAIFRKDGDEAAST
jgi:hypothetical protein